MARRLLIASLAGGVVLFFWGFAWYAAIPLHENSMKTFSNADDMASALATGTDGHGVYYYPSTHEEMAKKPFALVIYDPGGSPSMTPFMVKGFVGNLIAAAIVSLMLLTVVDPAASIGKRIGFVVAVYLTAAALCRIPDASWWHFPNSYLLLEVIFLAVGGVLVGAVTAMLTMPIADSSEPVDDASAS
ncbi:MAG: hypothetical protein H8E37_05840 [Planctomycetes bacterium]|nr:hypothetical protein [Planctomycetota bacterium]